MRDHLDGRLDTGPVLHLFGGPYLTLEGRRCEVPEGCKRLLAYVALQHQRVERRHTAEALWPFGEEGRAAGNLRSALWRLRGVGIEVLTVDKWWLTISDDVVVDVHVVTESADRLINGTATEGDLVVSPYWVDALNLLPGWYEDWALMERERLRQRTLHALEVLSKSLSDSGRFADSVDVALLAVGAEPLRESAQRALIEAHIAEGNLVEARRGCQTYRELLRRELGVEPSRDLITLVRRPTPQPIAVQSIGSALGHRSAARTS